MAHISWARPSRLSTLTHLKVLSVWWQYGSQCPVTPPRECRCGLSCVKPDLDLPHLEPRRSFSRNIARIVDLSKASGRHIKLENTGEATPSHAQGLDLQSRAPRKLQGFASSQTKRVAA